MKVEKAREGNNFNEDVVFRYSMKMKYNEGRESDGNPILDTKWD